MRLNTKSLLAGIVLLALALRLPFLSVPLEWDEGAYAYIATRWTAGDVPYRDVFDHKPPLVYLAYLPATILSNGSIEGIRLVGASWFLGTLVMVYLTARSLWGTTAAGIGALLYAIFGNSVRLQAINSNTEHLLVLPALGALYCFLQGTGKFRWLFVSGLLCGLSVLAKPVAALQFGVLVLASMSDQSSPARSAAASAKRAIALIMGFALPIAICCGYFWYQGAFDAFWQAVIDYNGLYVQYSNAQLMVVGGFVGWLAQVGYLQPVLGCLWILLYVALWRVLMRERTRDHLVLLAWTAAAFVGIKTGARDYPHYYVAILPALALWGGFALVRLRDQCQRFSMLPRLIRLATGAALGMATIFAASYVTDAARFYLSDSNRVLQAEYPPDAAELLSLALVIASVIRQETSPEEPILVWGSEPEIYYYAQRKSVTRFIYGVPFPLLPSALPEFVEQAKNGHPALVVTYGGVRDEQLALFLAAGQYRELTQTDHFVLYTDHR